MVTNACPSPRFRIVAALDRSEYAEIVLEHTIDQAARHDAPDLHFITVVKPGGDLEEAQRWLATEIDQGLELFGRAGPEWKSRIHVVEGNPGDEIANLAADLRADLIVIGRFGVHQKHGSIADRVLERATCPTLVVGLTEHVKELEPQCSDCVELRENSDGARWFCAAHADPGRVRLTTIVPTSSSLLHGGPLW